MHPRADPVSQIHALTVGEGVDVALELVGLPLTMDQAFRSLGVKGRVAIAGLTDKTFEIAPYADLLNKEAEIIGVSDHLAQEIPELIDWIGRGKLDLSQVVTQTISLDAAQINQILDQLDNFSEDVRVVIEP